MTEPDQYYTDDNHKSYTIVRGGKIVGYAQGALNRSAIELTRAAIVGPVPQNIERSGNRIRMGEL